MLLLGPVWIFGCNTWQLESRDNPDDPGSVFDFDGDGVPDGEDALPRDPSLGRDADGDNVDDAIDNCLGVPNVLQRDADADGVGDTCDPCLDFDGDGYGTDTSFGVCAGPDCDDFEEAAHQELCGDGITCGSEACDDASNDGGEGECLPGCAGTQSCGDGSTNGTEACDDGLNQGGELGCVPGCSKLQVCGDGDTDGTEACDDDDTLSNGEGECLGDCTAIQTCGDDTPNGTEACDDGDTIDNGEGGCLADCTGLQLCGDGDAEGTEACDDDFEDACGSCNTACTGVGTGPGACGDGTVCPAAGETCDDGFTDACGSCNEDCTGAGTGPGACGDGDWCPEFELCDDGFTESCGSCNATCTGPGTGSLGVCGDRMICAEAGEACDDGYTDACGTCNADCSALGSGPGTCGDGVSCPEYETCDDGFNDPCGSCNANCSAIGSGPGACGDGNHCPEFEACDDAFTDDCGTCNADCSATGTGSVCGDLETCAELETCDEGEALDCGLCNASCDGPGNEIPCGMVPISLGSSIYIDAFEPSLWSEPTCSGVQFGVVSDDYPAGFPDYVASEGCGPGTESCTGWDGAVDTVAGTAGVYACSVPGVLPSGYLTWYQAKAACENAGKRLCTTAEWLQQCQGAGASTFPYGNAFVSGTCNDGVSGATSIAPTGSFDQCTSNLPWGASFDLSGNVWEWLRECGALGCTHRGGAVTSAQPPHQQCTYSGFDNAWNPTASDATDGLRCCFDEP